MKPIKNLALVSCRSPFMDSDRIYPPLGLLYLEAVIAKEMPEVKVTLMDDYNSSDPELFNGFDAVGVSIMTPQREESRKLLDNIVTNTDAIAIAGGPHALHYHEEMIWEPWNFVVRKDGERDIIRILRGEQTERVSYDEIDKVTLADMPRPNRLKWADFLAGYSYELGGKKATTMLTGLGCSEMCSYCEDARTNIRWKSPEGIDAEVQDISDLGYGAVYIFDDLFAISMSKIKPFLKSIKKRDLIFRANAQARYFTQKGEEMAILLADHGCYEVAVGFESGSQKILDTVQKRTTVEQNYQTVEYAKKHGIKVKGFMMVGLPGENLETIAETERFIRDSGMDDFQLAIYYPYKGTQIRDNLEKGGIDLQFMGEGLGAYGQLGGSTESVIRTSALSSQDLLRIRDELVRKYKPKSHTNKWKDDKFFDHQLGSEVEYSPQPNDVVQIGGLRK